MNVYNIVWADDDIDNILDDETIKDLKAEGFSIVGIAHNGEELEATLRKPERVDAVIVDANFNETDTKIESERDTSGLTYARGLYIHKLQKTIPFFLFTNRSEELLREIYKHNSKFFEEDFPRFKRWFKKGNIEEYKQMLQEIKDTVDESKSPSFIIRNKYKNELNAASLINGAEEFIFEILVNDQENTLESVKEPFIRVRRIIEKTFGACETLKLIPPISDNTNGTAAYFVYNKYGQKEENTFRVFYEMCGDDIMPKPIAVGLKYIVDITQDGAHSKNKMKLKVDEYFELTKDTHLLKSVVFILIDVVKWFAVTALNNNNPDINESVLWRKAD